MGIKMDRFPVGFAGASPCSQSDDCVKEFTVHSGWIVDAISVNGKKYGQNGGSAKKIKLAPGEKVTKVKYGWRNYNGKDCLCQLMFYTNMNRKYGPFGSAGSSWSHHEVNNLPDDWTKTIEIDHYPIGFDKGTEFLVHSGWIVDAISVNGKKYGQTGGSTKKIKLAFDEKII